MLKKQRLGKGICHRPWVPVLFLLVFLAISGLNIGLSKAQATPGPIVANDDDYTNNPAGNDGYGGFSSSMVYTKSVYSNDRLDGNPVDPDAVILTIVDDGGLAGVTIGPYEEWTGAVKVPEGRQPGFYTATYRICIKNSPENCDTAKVTIAIYPWAHDYHYETKANTQMKGDLGKKSVYSPGSTFILRSNPSGSIKLNSDGTFTYTPKDGYIGGDYFQYKICLPSPHSSACGPGDVELSITKASSITPQLPIVNPTEKEQDHHTTPGANQETGLPEAAQAKPSNRYPAVLVIILLVLTIGFLTLRMHRKSKNGRAQGAKKTKKVSKNARARKGRIKK